MTVRIYLARAGRRLPACGTPQLAAYSRIEVLHVATRHIQATSGFSLTSRMESGQSVLSGATALRTEKCMKYGPLQSVPLRHSISCSGLVSVIAF